MTSTLERESSDLLYYNIRIPGSDDAEKIVEAQFRENRTDAILEDPSQWCVGMVRFYVPSLYIPIFKWGTQEPEPLEDPALSIYFKYGGVSVKRDVAYIPQSNDPSPTIGRLLWNYDDFVDMINVTIKQAFDAIKTEAGFPAVTEPRLVYDATTRLISLYTEKSMESGSGVEFGMSNLLYSYFPSFPVLEDAVTYPNKYVYFFKIKDNIINNVTYEGVPGYAIAQEFQTISIWNGVSKLLFESNTIPVDPELQQGQTNIQQRVLFDFILSDDQLTDRTAVTYFSTGGQRWTTLKSKYPMRKMDMNVSILFVDGSTAPLRLGKLDSVTAKLEFRRRDINGDIKY